MFDQRTSRKKAVRSRNLPCGLRRASLAAALALTSMTAAPASPPAAAPQPASSPAATTPARSEVQLELMPPLPLQIGRLVPAPSSGLRTNPHLQDSAAESTQQASNQAPEKATAQATEQAADVVRSTRVVAARASEPVAAVEAPPVLLRPAATVLTLRPISIPESRKAAESRGAAESRRAAENSSPALVVQSQSSSATEVTFVTPAEPPIINGEGGTSVVHATPATDSIHFSISDDGVSAKATLEHATEPRVTNERGSNHAEEDRSGGVARLAPRSRLIRPSIVAAPVAAITLDPPPAAERPTLPPMTLRGEAAQQAKSSATRPSAIAAKTAPAQATPAKTATVPADPRRGESAASEDAPPKLLRNATAAVIPVPRASATTPQSTASPLATNPLAARQTAAPRSKIATSAASDRPQAVLAPTTAPAQAAASKIATVSQHPTGPAPWDLTAASLGEAEAILLRTAETQTITPRSPIRRVQLEDREVCEAVQVGPHKLLLIGRRDGTTRLAVWSDSDSKPALYEIRIGSAQSAPAGGSLGAVAERLTETIAAAYPQCHVRVVTEGDGLAVHGQAVSQEAARAIMRLVRRACLTSVDDDLEIR